MSRWRRPGGGVRGKVPRRRRTRPMRGDSGPFGVGKGLRGTEVPDAVGLGHCALRGSGDPCLGKGTRPIGPACGGDTAPPAGRRDPAGEGAPASKRGRSARTGKSTRPTAVTACRRPPPPAPGSEGVSEDVTGGDYSLVRAVVWLPLTGRSGGWRGAPPPGRPPRAVLSALQPAPRAHSSPPRAPPVAKFGSTLTWALTPCPFHLPSGPWRPRRTRRRLQRSPGDPYSGGRRQ